MFRDLKTEANSYGLSIKLADGSLGNYLIKNTPNGFMIRGTLKQFAALSELVQYYSSKLRPGHPNANPNPNPNPNPLP
jgi:hypothetical protein